MIDDKKTYPKKPERLRKLQDMFENIIKVWVRAQAKRISRLQGANKRDILSHIENNQVYDFEPNMS